mmetsp:Transcript_68444/g.113779  ORF Transcript_68444/g.113779 Transcript_68444/m.113779 type:complete len:322 (+) Transcript_68444:72-1037(+)
METNMETLMPSPQATLTERNIEGIKKLPHAGSPQQARDQLAQRLSLRYRLGQAKRVLLFVSDGMGLGTQYATRIWEGQVKGLLGEEHATTLDSAMHVGVTKTYNLNGQTPDSAATASAFMNGRKTISRVVNTLPILARGQCNESHNPADYGIPLFMDMAHKLGFHTGVVSTARLTHATPASVYAVSSDRIWEYEVPDGCPQNDIAEQLVAAMEAGRIDVAIGGGWRSFANKSAGGKRNKGDLLSKMRSAGVHVTDSRHGFDAISNAPTKAPRVFCAFRDDNNGSHLSYEVDRDASIAPSLAEMTLTAIRVLSQDEMIKRSL